MSDKGEMLEGVKITTSVRPLDDGERTGECSAYTGGGSRRVFGGLNGRENN